LDGETVAILERHRHVVDERMPQPSTAFLFSDELDGSRPWVPHSVTERFIVLRNRAALPGVRLHDLRHFTATQLIGAGVDVRTVAGRLGHSDPSLTLRVYSHVIEERDRAAAAVMGSVLSKAPKKAKAKALKAG